MLIVTDGAVDLPEWLGRSPAVRVVPGQVWLEGEPFTGAPQEFWSLLRSGTYPSTTPPTVSGLAAAYAHQDPVVAVHVSSQLSATVARAREAAGRASGGITIVDSGSLSVGAGLIVAALCRPADTASLTSGPESVAEYARRLPEWLHTFVLIQDVETLRRSDRSGLLPRGHLARNRPLLLAVRGRVVPLEQTKNRQSAIRGIVTHVRRSAGTDLGAWALGHGDAADRDDVTIQLIEAFGMSPAFSVSLDPTVGAHVGPDALIVAAISR